MVQEQYMLLGAKGQIENEIEIKLMNFDHGTTAGGDR